jgi:hypothetical protein
MNEVKKFKEKNHYLMAFNSIDAVGETIKPEGPGEVFYIHCDMTKEDQIKVNGFKFTITFINVVER